MKKSHFNNVIIEIILLIFICILYSLKDNCPQILTFGNLFFVIGLFLLTILLFGFPKAKNYLNKISIRYIIIMLLAYLMTIYLLGLFTGFTKSVFSLKFIDIIKNITPIAMIIIFKELNRYVLLKNANKSQTIVIMILFVFWDLVTKHSLADVGSLSQLFVFVSLNFIPTIVKESLCCYMTKNISFYPTLIYAMAMEIVIYVLPIYPNLGNYLNSIIGIVFPYLIYKTVSKMINYKKKNELNFNKQYFLVFTLPVVTLLIVVVILVSGVFTYQMVAIGSDSMNPIYYMGDAIIYKKMSAHNLKEKDILVFNYNGSMITHRITKIINKNGKLYFQTKGDNNKNIDASLVEEKDVYGKVKYIVKYLGYPTIWIQDLFGKR